MNKIAITVLCAVATLSLSSCGAGTFTAEGELVLSYNQADGVDKGAAECHGALAPDGSKGWDDIEDGARVVINADDKRVGTGKLGTGVPGNDECVFDFTVADVEAGHDLYEIHVGSHPTSSEYTLEELEEGSVSLTVEG